VTSPRHRFSLISAGFALMLGWLMMPALAIVKVSRACMGIEHEQFWRRTGLSLMAALTRAAGFLSRLHVRFIAARTHALFEPIAASRWRSFSSSCMRTWRSPRRSCWAR
jgi:hypothetical protein